MALPPRGNPRRPLHLAIRSCRSVGGLFGLFGLIALLPIFLRPGPQRTFSPGALVGVIVPTLMYFTAAAGFYTLAHFMKKRQLWAVVVALVLAIIVFGSTLAGLLVLVWVARTVMLLSGPGLILTVIVGLIVLEMGRLVYYLARSFDAIRYLPEDEVRGFEPIFPVSPPISSTSATAENNPAASPSSPAPESPPQPH